MPTREKFDEVATKLQKLRPGSADSCHNSWIGLSKDNEINEWYWFFGSRSNRVLDSNDERWAAREPKIDDPANVDYDDYNVGYIDYDVGFISVDGSQGKIHTANSESTKLCSFLCAK